MAKKIGDLMTAKAQVGIEYMMVVGFVTLAIVSVLTLAYFYSDQIKDSIRLNQVESFATQVLNSAESVFFAGEPSKTTVKLYLPEGVNEITVSTDINNPGLLIKTRTRVGGENIRFYESNVPLSGSISSTEGIKKIAVVAEETQVSING